MNFIELVYEFSKSKSALESLMIFRSNNDKCIKNDLELISCDKDMALNMPIFKDIMDIQNIETIFQYPNLSFLNKKIVHDMSVNEKSDIVVDYSISFESNTARYLHDYLRYGKNTKNFAETLHLLLEKDYNLDPIFYIIENVVNGNTSHDFFENMKSIKVLMTCDMNLYKKTKEIKSIYTDYELELMCKKDIEFTTFNQQEFIESAKEQNLILQIIILLILIAPRKYKGNLESQIQYIIKFMAEKLKTIFLRELTVAMNYLNFNVNKKEFIGTEEHKKYQIFNKLNTNNKVDFFSALQNTAWDFMHIRYLETYFSTKPNPEADFFIPFIFTYDEGLLNTIKMFYCKDILLFKGDNTSIPMPEENLDLSILNDSTLKKYFTLEASISRSQEKQVDLLSIFEELKNEIVRLNPNLKN